MNNLMYYQVYIYMYKCIRKLNVQFPRPMPARCIYNLLIKDHQKAYSHDQTLTQDMHNNN